MKEGGDPESFPGIDVCFSFIEAVSGRITAVPASHIRFQPTVHGKKFVKLDVHVLKTTRVFACLMAGYWM